MLQICTVDARCLETSIWRLGSKSCFGCHHQLHIFLRYGFLFFSAQLQSLSAFLVWYFLYMPREPHLTQEAMERSLSSHDMGQRDFHSLFGFFRRRWGDSRFSIMREPSFLNGNTARSRMLGGCDYCYGVSQHVPRSEIIWFLLLGIIDRCCFLYECFLSCFPV